MQQMQAVHTMRALGMMRAEWFAELVQHTAESTQAGHSTLGRAHAASCLCCNHTAVTRKATQQSVQRCFDEVRELFSETPALVPQWDASPTHDA